jgi:hypothetical protein
MLLILVWQSYSNKLAKYSFNIALSKQNYEDRRLDSKLAEININNGIILVLKKNIFLQLIGYNAMDFTNS